MLRTGIIRKTNRRNVLRGYSRSTRDIRKESNRDEKERHTRDNKEILHNTRGEWNRLQASKEVSCIKSLFNTAKYPIKSYIFHTYQRIVNNRVLLHLKRKLL